MIYKNMIDLAVPSVDEVVKVGDTITDIKEGLNAKVWTIGVISGSNEMGITEEEYNQLSDAERDNRKQEVRQRIKKYGNGCWMPEPIMYWTILPSSRLASHKSTSN